MISSLHHLVMEAAHRHPEKNAVVLGSESITYRELDQRSNQLAHALLAKGCRRGDRVAIYMNKSIPALVSIYGVLKAGAAYVPLDSSSPLSRLEYILRDCGVRCAVASGATIRALADLFPDGRPLETVVLTDPAPTLDGGPEIVSWNEVRGFDAAPPPDLQGSEADLAYVLYTS